MSADEPAIDTEQLPIPSERCGEVGQARGLVQGRLTEQAAAGREAGGADGR
jgi:hypothetical protein